MDGIASGPPVLKGEMFLIHPTFSKWERRGLTARIQFFSGDIVQSMSNAQFIMLPQATSVSSMTRAEVNRVRSPEMLEDYLKKKLGSVYSTYLDLPILTSEAESPSDPELNATPSPKPAKSFKQPRVLDTATSAVKGPAKPKRSRYTETELDLLAEYMMHNPPTSVKPSHPYWETLRDECAWARTHSAPAWYTWSTRHGKDWMAQAVARSKALETTSRAPTKPSKAGHSAKTLPYRTPKQIETIVLSSPDESQPAIRVPKNLKAISVAQTLAQSPPATANYRPPSSSNKSADPEETESSGDDIPPHPENPPKQVKRPTADPIRPLSPPRPNPSRPHLGFACWRRRPRVLVADSDPSQATTTTQTMSTGVAFSQFTQPISLQPISTAQKSRDITQSSTSASQKPRAQSQRGSPVASAGGSGTSGRNPWVSQAKEELDGEYKAKAHFVDSDSDDDGWSENSSDSETEDEEQETLLHTSAVVGSGLPNITGKRRSYVQTEDAASSEFRDLVDSHLPGYFERAVIEYGGTQFQMQSTYETQATEQSQSQPLTEATRASKRGVVASSRKKQKRRQIVNAVLSLVSHWMNIPLSNIRNAWKSLPREKRTFQGLQKRCLQCDLSTNRKEYDATGLFTQLSPRSRVRKLNDQGGPARKKRKLTTFPPLRRAGNSGTEAGHDDKGEESELYFGCQDPDAPAGGNYVEEQEDDDENEAEREPPPILFRQIRLAPVGMNGLRPYHPDKEWARRICRVLAAVYGWRQASKVYEIWEGVDGDAKLVEKALKDKSIDNQRTLLDLGLGDIPRPWA